MTAYWRWHRTADLILAATFSWIFCVLLPPRLVVLTVTNESMRINSLDYLSISMSTFALIAATVAFMFTIIDMDEFRILRQSKSRFQFWQISSWCLQVLFMQSGWYLFLHLAGGGVVSFQVLLLLTSFMLLLSIVSLSKFTWLLSKIVEIKSARP